jgi:hypothetical protein
MMSDDSYWAVLEVEVTDQFIDWWSTLSDAQREAVTDRVDLLAERGPDLGRPVVDRIHSSRHQSMKELRAAKGGALRVLFSFDPAPPRDPAARRRQVGRVERPVRVGRPDPDDLYDEYLRELDEEGLI